MLFDNKVVLITGAGSGIGRETALAFAREGAKLILSDINDEGGAETAGAIQKLGVTAQYLQVDVTQSAEVKAMVDAAVEQFGGLDVAVNCAGIGDFPMQATHEFEETIFRQIMEVNLHGLWLCMKHELPVMLENGGGNIINIASAAGIAGSRGGAAYAASKHAVVGLTRSAALDYAKLNIRVNAVCPSYIDTPMVSGLMERNPKLESIFRRTSPMRRLGKPEEVADSILWLASDKASFINGVALPIDGGLFAM